MPFDRIVNTGQLIMQDFDKLGVFYLGRLYDVANKTGLKDLLLYDSKDLVTHAVCIGMTGSGKTGLCLSLIEEAATDGVPTIAIDPKGDITNLLLTFPDLESKDFEPWINQEDAAKGFSHKNMQNNRLTSGKMVSQNGGRMANEFNV